MCACVHVTSDLLYLLDPRCDQIEIRAVAGQRARLLLTFVKHKAKTSNPKHYAHIFLPKITTMKVNYNYLRFKGLTHIVKEVCSYTN